jgi:hypothetical protein
MATQSFLDVLRQTVARLQAAYPARSGDIARAHALITLGMVTPATSDPATGRVLSSDGQTWYEVNGSCTCHAGQHGQQCKHVHAWKLYQFVERRLATQASQDGRPPAGEGVEMGARAAAVEGLGEAAASVNVRVTIRGRECQLTLRDHDEARLLVRLEAILERFPMPEVTGQASTLGGQGKDWCAVHQTRMQRHANAKGVWYSHFIDGAHCKGQRREGQRGGK